MGKSNDDVIKEFNEYVNMTESELRAWLKNPESDKAGLGPGKESGHKIADILSRNPNKDPSKYTDADVDHCRRVAAYCKRHLAQESHLKSEKSAEELAHAKSTISLKNWGHDPTKNKSGNEVKGDKGSAGKQSAAKGKKAAPKAGTKRSASKKSEANDAEDEEAAEPRDDAEGKEAAVEENNAGEAAEGEAEGEEPPSKKAKKSKGGKKK